MPSSRHRPARFSVYTKLSKEVRDIYGRFTDHIEPFGIDECWLDVTKSGVFGSGYEIAGTDPQGRARRIGFKRFGGGEFQQSICETRQRSEKARRGFRRRPFEFSG